MPAPYNVLFICTGNACRSQMAEALLRHMGGDRFNAHSAGTEPAGFIHPLVIETMERMNVPIEGQYSKGWNEFAREPHDIIITLCDNAASQPCPAWSGNPATAHWSLPDPSFYPGSEHDRRAAAEAIARRLQYWIGQLITLPLDNLTPDQLKSELQRIGEV